MATKWIPPLPAGFEARWDPNQRAYFFINHRDKTTTWQDPRFPPQPSAHQAAAQNLNQRGAGTGNQATNIPMQTKTVQFGSTTATGYTPESDESDASESETDFDSLFASTTGDHGKKLDLQKFHKIRQMYPSAPEDVIKSFLLRNNNVEVLTVNQLFEAGYQYSRDTASPHPPPKVVDMTERLRAMFPTANSDLVNDILAQSNNDEKKARARLEAIGYKATFPATHKSPSRETPSRSSSPANRATSPAKRATSPAKPKLSELEKNKKINNVKSQYPLIERSVIEMALQVCNYDESRVKSVLDRMADTPAQSRPGTSTSTSTTRAVSPTRNISYSLEPAVFDNSDISSPSPAMKETSPPKGKGSKPKTPSSRPQSSTSRSPAPRSPAPRSAPQQRAKQVTHGPTRGVVSNQPSGGAAYISSNRTPAKGPDPSLRVGPNKDLLLQDYTSAKGPNLELRQGPDPQRVQGSQGAVGPDKFLVCGQMNGLSSGPAAGLNQEPGGRRVLITAI